jgi:hypothetical protein
MPLKLVTGRANAGKTGWILKWALDSLKAGVPPTLIVPNLVDVRRLQAELAGKAPLGIRVATPRALAEDLWQLHGDGRRLVGQATRAAVVRQILAGVVEASLTESAGTPGFERLLVQAAQQCDVSKRSSTAGFSDAGNLVLSLLDTYRDRLGAMGLVEPRWIASILAMLPPEVGFLGFLRFTTFSEADLVMICSFSKENTVGVALEWEEGFAPTRANDRAAARLLERAIEVRLAAESGGDAELEAVAIKARPRGGRLLPTGRVIVGEARGAEAEAALAAAMVADAVRAGARPERVAVVFGQLAPRVNLVRNAMAAEDIACTFDCPTTVGATTFGRALIALVRIALGVGARAEALQFLQGPFSDAGADEVLRLDKSWRSRRRAEDGHVVMADIIRIGGDSGSAAALARALSKRLLDGEAVERWQILADSLLATGFENAPKGLDSQDVAAHGSFTRAVAEMASVPGHPFGAKDVLDALATLECSASADESPGLVQVIQASRVGARRFDVVIIAGLTQNEFPLANRETFASEIRVMAAPGGISDDEANAELAFYTLLTRPRSQLGLVRQSVNSEGAPLAASPLLDQVLDLYRYPSGDRMSAKYLWSALGMVRLEDARSFVPVFTRGRRGQRQLPEKAMPSGRQVAHGSFSPEVGQPLFQDRVFSATEIEAYLQCPYSWFYSRVLRPRDIDAQMDAAALGSRAHRLISDFYEAMKLEGRRRVTPETLPEALQLFEQTAEKSERAMAPAQGLSEEIDVGRAHMWARHVVEDDAFLLRGYAPHGHELVFGMDHSFEFAGVRIAGRVDRVDVGPTGAVVTDYKSARDVGKPARLGAGSGIQHILYALATEKLMGLPVVGSVYRSLRSRQMRGYWRGDLIESLPTEACEKDVLDATGFSAMIEDLEERVTTAVEGIAAGAIPRTPRSADSCRYCSLKQICEGARA